MYIFNSDLDNTLIYSYKHNIGEDKVNVEIYDGRQISFMTRKSYNMLKDVNERMIFVPTTTRTVEQYKRINLGISDIKYALTCNGGILLKHGVPDSDWYKESRKLVCGCDEIIAAGIELLEKDINVNFEIRNIERLFVFTKSSEPEQTAAELRKHLNTDMVSIHTNGAKVYIVPQKLNKGSGIKRLKKALSVDKTVAAGDSEFDIPMLKAADISFAPYELKSKVPQKTTCLSGKGIFSDELLSRCLLIAYVPLPAEDSANV